MSHTGFKKLAIVYMVGTERLREFCVLVILFRDLLRNLKTAPFPTS
jgi:hypothetical protein